MNGAKIVQLIALCIIQIALWALTAQHPVDESTKPAFALVGVFAGQGLQTINVADVRRTETVPYF